MPPPFSRFQGDAVSHVVVWGKNLLDLSHATVDGKWALPMIDSALPAYVPATPEVMADAIVSHMEVRPLILYTILLLPIVYGVQHSKGESVKGRTLLIRRAIPLQQCGHYRWEGQYNDNWLVHESVEVNKDLVTAKRPLVASHSL